MEYSLAFAQQLIEAAKVPKRHVPELEEANRALLYLSLVSIELSLKYLLEKAGVPIKTIRNRSHSLQDLLNDLENCEIKLMISESQNWVSASRIRARIVSPAYFGATIGNLIESECKGASKYPNEIRYGSTLRHFPPELIFECAVKVVEWACDYGEAIRVKPC